MDIADVLAQYTHEATADELRTLEPSVDDYLVVVRAAAATRDFVDLRLAEQIADALRVLLAVADDYTGRERALLAGAVGYFTHVDDENSDLTSATGLEDDAEVLNAVCRYLSRSDLQIDLS